ncbi:MAG: transposase [Acidobacteriota bacterium]
MRVGLAVSAQTASNVTRDLDAAANQLHQARLKDEWAYLLLDGMAVKVRRTAERQQVQSIHPGEYTVDGRARSE